MCIRDSVLAIGLVVAVAFAANGRPRTPNFTVATAVQGSITQVFGSSGVVSRPGQSALDFDTPGVVTSVRVQVGDEVAKGDVLATVDTAPLQVGLLQAQAQLAQARAVLDADRAAKANGGTVIALPQSSAPAGGGGGGKPPAPLPTSTATPTIPGYVVDMQASMARLQASVVAQQAACAPVYVWLDKLGEIQGQLPTALPTTLPTAHPSITPSVTPGTPSVSPLPSPSGPTPGTPSPSGTPEPTAPTATGSPTPTTGSPTPTTVPSIPKGELEKVVGQIQACSDAMLGLAAAQQDAGQAIATASLGMAQDTAAAQQQLAAAQAQLTAGASAAAQQAAEEAMARAQAQLAAQAQRSIGSQVTDATIAADSARVLSAQQSVDAARRAVDAATLVSPISGVVGQLSFTAGESSAGRSVTVVGPGLAEVTVEVPLRLRGLVSGGHPADVGLVGTDPVMQGTVVSVSDVPTSATGTPTYRAVVHVDDPAMTLYTGAKTLVDIPLRTASDVVTAVSYTHLTLPTSDLV